jgi:hypothetical protein
MCQIQKFYAEDGCIGSEMAILAVEHQGKCGPVSYARLSEGHAFRSCDIAQKNNRCPGANKPRTQNTCPQSLHCRRVERRRASPSVTSTFATPIAIQGKSLHQPSYAALPRRRFFHPDTSRPPKHPSFRVRPPRPARMPPEC